MGKKWIIGVVLAALLAVLSGCGKSGKNTAVIPRRTFFGNPDRAAVRISPDGKHISFLA